MKSLEFARDASKYIGNTAKEISGVGVVQRAIKDLPQESKFKSLPYTVVGGIGSKLLLPSVDSASVESRNIRAGIDLVSDVITIFLVGNGHYQTALMLKLNYNTLIQIAPDVAKLAKRKIL